MPLGRCSANEGNEGFDGPPPRGVTGRAVLTFSDGGWRAGREHGSRKVRFGRKEGESGMVCEERALQWAGFVAGKWERENIASTEGGGELGKRAIFETGKDLAYNLVYWVCVPPRRRFFSRLQPRSKFFAVFSPAPEANDRQLSPFVHRAHDRRRSGAQVAWPPPPPPSAPFPRSRAPLYRQSARVIEQRNVSARHSTSVPHSLNH